jgi:hypothetical protein
LPVVNFAAGGLGKCFVAWLEMIRVTYG